jgi:hypothetical protein
MKDEIMQNYKEEIDRMNDELNKIYGPWRLGITMTLLVNAIYNENEYDVDKSLMHFDELIKVMKDGMKEKKKLKKDEVHYHGAKLKNYEVEH